MLFRSPPHRQSFRSRCPEFDENSCPAGMVAGEDCTECVWSGRCPYFDEKTCPAGWVANADCSDCEPRDKCFDKVCLDGMALTHDCDCVYLNCPYTARCEGDQVLNENSCACEFDSPCPDYPKDICSGNMVFSPSCQLINNEPCVCGLHCSDGHVADATCSFCE